MRWAVLAAVLASAPAAASEWEHFTYTNPGDAAWCQDERASKWITMQWNEGVDRGLRATAGNPEYWNQGFGNAMRVIGNEKIVALENMRAGSYSCSSNVPGTCAPTPKRHACHATVVQRNGKRSGVTFFVNDDTGAVQAETDAQRRAAGD